MADEKHFVVTLKRSGAGRQSTQRRTLEGLGLRRLGKTVYLKDSPAIRGMIYKVIHLVEVTAAQGPIPSQHLGRRKQGRDRHATA